MNLDTGRVVTTIGIAERQNSDVHNDADQFSRFIFESLGRHKNGDWGKVCKEDKEQNDLAAKTDERIMSVYEYNNQEKIWIITERDRSYTTILFPHEY